MLMIFGKWLRLVREQAGLRQARLAEAMGVTPAYLSKLELERGHKATPGEEKLRAAAALLGVSGDEVVCRAGRVPADIAELLTRHPERVDAVRKAARGKLKSKGRPLTEARAEVVDTVIIRRDHGPPTVTTRPMDTDFAQPARPAEPVIHHVGDRPLSTIEAAAVAATTGTKMVPPLAPCRTTRDQCLGCYGKPPHTCGMSAADQATHVALLAARKPPPPGVGPGETYVELDKPPTARAR